MERISLTEHKTNEEVLEEVEEKGPLISVATRWVFSQDLGFSDIVLGSWFFPEGLGIFLGLFKTPRVFLGFFRFYRKYII